MEETLVENSTLLKIVPSLETITRALTNTATHHDHMIALITIIMREAGFFETTPRPETDELNPSEIWKSSPQSTYYELKFAHSSENELLDCKIVAVPVGDVIIVNLQSHFARARCIAIQTLMYVNPYSSDLCGRFMNLKELSHRFKDSLTTPMKGEILTTAGIMNASLAGLPIELKCKILRMLELRDIRRLSQTCREFRDLCRDCYSR